MVERAVRDVHFTLPNITVLRDLPSVLDLDPPLSEEILDFEEFALHEGPIMINELVRLRIPADLQSRQAEIQTFMQNIFQDGVELLLRRYASRSTSSMSRNATSSTLRNWPDGFGGIESRIGDDTSHRQHDTSQNFGSSQVGSSSTVHQPLNWAPEQFSQGLGVGTEANNTYPPDGFDIPTNWDFDESWLTSGDL